MVVVLGGLTIWLHNETFIKIKPTIYYAFVAALLASGWRPAGQSSRWCWAAPTPGSTMTAGAS